MAIHTNLQSKKAAHTSSAANKFKEKATVNTHKTAAIIAGALILLATVTFMAGDGLISSILDNPDYLSHVYANKTQLIVGVLLEFVDAAAIVGVGVVLFPILKKHSEPIALGYVVTRIIESAMLLVSGVSLLLLPILSQEYGQASGLTTSYFQTLSTLVVAQSDLAFQIAMIVLGLGSLPFCYLLFKSNLIPRFMSVLGFIGYATMLIGIGLEILGYGVGLMIFLPGGVFELIFPIWLFVKGFNSSATASGTVKQI